MSETRGSQEVTSEMKPSELFERDFGIGQRIGIRLGILFGMIPIKAGEIAYSIYGKMLNPVLLEKELIQYLRQGEHFFDSLIPTGPVKGTRKEEWSPKKTAAFTRWSCVLVTQEFLNRARKERNPVVQESFLLRVRKALEAGARITESITGERLDRGWLNGLIKSSTSLEEPNLLKEKLREYVDNPLKAKTV